MTIHGAGTSSVTLDTSSQRNEALLHVSSEAGTIDATIHFDSNALRAMALTFEAAAMELDARAVR